MAASESSQKTIEDNFMNNDWDIIPVGWSNSLLEWSIKTIWKCLALTSKEGSSHMREKLVCWLSNFYSYWRGSFVDWNTCYGGNSISLGVNIIIRAIFV